MADYDGEFIWGSSTPPDGYDGYAGVACVADGDSISSLYKYESNFEFSISANGEAVQYKQTTTHYHKRAWRTESSAFVEWETTDLSGAYPGGGTLEPTLGAIVYWWTS
jgi:hypothetical protein